MIDWRAPAAAPFYRATAADPMQVIRRRMIASAPASGSPASRTTCSTRTPRPPDMRVIGDGALVASLARTTGTGMRDIVATIQREQDEAIRSPASGVTLVRGGPGTGKTAVALHRAAYLLYSDRQRFAGGGVLVVGPSPVFVNYIARVLPSLGEDEVTLASLGSLRARRGARPGTTRPTVATIKGSARMATVLARAVRDNPPGAPAELRLLYRGQLLRLDRAATGPAARHRARRSARRATRCGARPPGTCWTRSGSRPATCSGRAGTTPREEFAEQIAERREFIAFMRAWWPVLRAGRRAAAGSATRPGCAGTPTGCSTAARSSCCAARVPAPRDGRRSRSRTSRCSTSSTSCSGTPPTQAAGRRPTRTPSAASGRSPPTRTGRRRRGGRVERPADYREYAHIVVDEAQDVSPMQWRMIGRRAAYASWTIVGDPAQSAWQGDPAETRKARDAALRGRKRNEYTLTTNYRNSVEIFDVAAPVVRRAEPDIELPTAVRRSGVEPVHVVVDRGRRSPDAVRDGVAELLAERGRHGRRDRRRSAGGTRSPRWLGHDRPTPRLQVVTSLEAKGMEYDGVLVVEPGAIVAESPSGVRTLYVALSRATQRLTTVATDDGLAARLTARRLLLSRTSRGSPRHSSTAPTTTPVSTTPGTCSASLSARYGRAECTPSTVPGGPGPAQTPHA